MRNRGMLGFCWGSFGFSRFSEPRGQRRARGVVCVAVNDRQMWTRRRWWKSPEVGFLHG